MSRIRLPGPREVAATLDEPTEVSADACVVACPPHPEFGGNRSDRRLRAVADALVESGIACLRFDYGPWDEGTGEQTDANRALDWAADQYDRIGLFGYSFGAAVALLTAADRSDLVAVAVLAPPGSLADGSDVVGAVERITAPTLIVYGERDDTVDGSAVIARARLCDRVVESFPADHHFVGQHEQVAERTWRFFESHL